MTLQELYDAIGEELAIRPGRGDSAVDVNVRVAPNRRLSRAIKDVSFWYAEPYRTVVTLKVNP